MTAILVGLGILLILAGLLWPWLQRINLFHLPGDIVIEKEHFRFYFPITTAILLSALASLLLWLWRRFMG